MGWVDEHLGHGPCRGVIIASEIGDDLRTAVLRVPGVSPFRYQMKVRPGAGEVGDGVRVRELRTYRQSCTSRPDALAPLAQVSAELKLPGARPTTRGRRGEGALSEAGMAHARVPARRWTADGPAGARPAAGRRRNAARLVGGEARADVLAGRVTADLSAGARPAARQRLGNEARLVGWDAPAEVLAGLLTADKSAGAGPAAGWRLGS